MKKYNLKLEIVCEKEYKNIEANSIDEAEMKAIQKFMDDYAGEFDIDENNLSGTDFEEI